MRVRSLILAFAGATLAIPFASVDLEASSATMDFARAEISQPPKHVAEHHNRKDLLKRENEHVASIDIARRGGQSEASIDIARRGEQSEASIDIARRDEQSIDIA